MTKGLWRQICSPIWIQGWHPYLKYAFTEVAIKAMMYYPEIKQFADRVAKRSNKTIARTVVAKELARCAYFVLTRQQEFKSFKGIEINKLRDWPCDRKPLRLTGDATISPTG